MVWVRGWVTVGVFVRDDIPILYLVLMYYVVSQLSMAERPPRLLTSCMHSPFLWRFWDWCSSYSYSYLGPNQKHCALRGTSKPARKPELRMEELMNERVTVHNPKTLVTLTGEGAPRRRELRTA